jgi:Zn-dependent membrane protease YugP
MKEPLNNILATLSTWRSVRVDKPKEGARIVVFCLHRNGVYDIHIGRRYGKRYFQEDYSGYKPTVVLSCARYWKYAQGAISKYQDEK